MASETTFSARRREAQSGAGRKNARVVRAYGVLPPADSQLEVVVVAGQETWEAKTAQVRRHPLLMAWDSNFRARCPSTSAAGGSLVSGSERHAGSHFKTRATTSSGRSPPPRPWPYQSARRMSFPLAPAAILR